MVTVVPTLSSHVRIDSTMLGAEAYVLQEHGYGNHCTRSVCSWQTRQRATIGYLCGTVDRKDKACVQGFKTILSSLSSATGLVWQRNLSAGNTKEQTWLLHRLLRVTMPTVSYLAKAREVLACVFARDGARGVIGYKLEDQYQTTNNENK